MIEAEYPNEGLQHKFDVLMDASGDMVKLAMTPCGPTDILNLFFNSLA